MSENNTLPSDRVHNIQSDPRFIYFVMWRKRKPAGDAWAELVFGRSIRTSPFGTLTERQLFCNEIKALS